MLKILQARLQQNVNQEFADVQVGFRKCRGTRDQIANICWIIEKNKQIPKILSTVNLASLTMLKPLTVWMTINYGKFLKRWEYQTTLPASCERWMQIKKQYLEQDIEQLTSSKLGKSYIKIVYCYLAYLTYMQSKSWEIPGWMKHKLESRLWREISITPDMQMSHCYSWRDVN